MVCHEHWRIRFGNARVCCIISSSLLTLWVHDTKYLSPSRYSKCVPCRLFELIQCNLRQHMQYWEYGLAIHAAGRFPKSIWNTALRTSSDPSSIDSTRLAIAMGRDVCVTALDRFSSYYHRPFSVQMVTVMLDCSRLIYQNVHGMHVQSRHNQLHPPHLHKILISHSSKNAIFHTLSSTTYSAPLPTGGKSADQTKV